jgi:hypothetical protein
MTWKGGLPPRAVGDLILAVHFDQERDSAPERCRHRRYRSSRGCFRGHNRQGSCLAERVDQNLEPPGLVLLLAGDLNAFENGSRRILYKREINYVIGRFPRVLSIAD